MLSITFIISAFNLALFFIVIPVAWTLLGLLSMMFKAEHRPQPPVKFYHVGIVSTSLAIFLASMAVGADFVATNTPQYLFAGVSGAALAAFAIGIPAGFLTVFAYRVILRPPAYPAP